MLVKILEVKTVKIRRTKREKKRYKRPYKKKLISKEGMKFRRVEK